MRVRLGETVAADIPMDIEVGDHSAIYELCLYELAREPDSLGPVQLTRNGELDLARQLGIDPLLRPFDRVPQSLTIGQMLRRAVGQHHFGANDACLVREIVMAIEALVVQSRG